MGIPWVHEMLTTVSTDDAYVNGHVTYVAPRVNGQVAKVFVSDNNVVRKGDLLLELDSEPYQVQVNIAQAAVDAAKADLITAQAQVCGIEATDPQPAIHHEARDRGSAQQNRGIAGHRWQASIRRRPLWRGRRRTISEHCRFKRPMLARSVHRMSIDIKRHIERRVRKSIRRSSTSIKFVSAWDCRQRRNPRQTLPKYRPTWIKRSVAVREVQGKLMEAAAALGVSGSFNKLPHDMEKDFFSRYPNQDIDQIFAKLLKDAPDIKRAETKLLQAERNLDQAKLNLRYCKVYAEIDGAITRKNVNPGNNVSTGPKRDDDSIPQ